MPLDAVLDSLSLKSRPRRGSDTGGFILQRRDEAVLCDVFGQVALTLEDAVGLGHFGSRSRAQRRMALLTEQGLLRRFLAPDLGSLTFYYTLGRRAASLVSSRLELELEQVRRFIRADCTPSLLRHASAITGFRIALQRAAARQSELGLERWLPERLIREEYELEVGGRWQRCQFRPDAFFRVSWNQRYFPFMLEVDCGNAGRKAWQRTVNSYARHQASGLFSERYGQERFQAMVITTTSTRLMHLMEIAGEQQEVAFLGTTRSEIAQLGIIGPIWSIAGRQAKVPLMVALETLPATAHGTSHGGR